MKYLFITVGAATTLLLALTVAALTEFGGSKRIADIVPEKPGDGLESTPPGSIFEGIAPASKAVGPAGNARLADRQPTIEELRDPELYAAYETRQYGRFLAEFIRAADRRIRVLESTLAGPPESDRSRRNSNRDHRSIEERISVLKSERKHALSRYRELSGKYPQSLTPIDE